MNRKISSVLLVTALVCSFALMSPIPQVDAQAGGKKTIVFITGYGMGAYNLANVTAWLQSKGHTVRVGTTINSSILAGADALILSSFYGPASGIAELDAVNGPALFNTIKTWFDLGNKFLWVSGDSDYGGRDWIALNCSQLLQTLGSPLRVDPTSVEDVYTWASQASTQRVRANESYSNPVSLEITNRVINSTGITGNGVLFHGPAPVYALNATGYPKPLHNNTIADIYPIIGISAHTGKIVENSYLYPGVVHVDQAFGKWVLAAAEDNAGPANNNRIICSGAAPYADYRPFWLDAYYGVPLNGTLFVKQALYWGLGVTPGPPTSPTLTDPGATSTTGSFSVSWSASTDPDGVVTSYALQMSSSLTFAVILDSWTPTVTSQAVSGLTDGTYYFRVRAVADEGDTSAWSNNESITVAIPTTTTTTTLPPIPGFPILAIAAGAVLAVGFGLLTRRRKLKG